MSGTPLYLAGEFPGNVSRILELESENQTFLDLAGAYDTLSAELQDLETGIDRFSGAYFAQLQRQRHEIRDILCAMLNAD